MRIPGTWTGKGETSPSTQTTPSADLRVTTCSTATTASSRCGGPRLRSGPTTTRRRSTGARSGCGRFRAKVASGRICSLTRTDSMWSYRAGARSTSRTAIRGKRRSSTPRSRRVQRTCSRSAGAWCATQPSLSPSRRAARAWSVRSRCPMTSTGRRHTDSTSADSRRCARATTRRARSPSGNA